MSRSVFAAFATAVLMLFMGASHGADSSEGKALHDENCSRCHDAQVYTRPDRRVTSLAELEAQVRRCDSALGTTWFDDEIAAVVQYLNEQYYEF